MRVALLSVALLAAIGPPALRAQQARAVLDEAAAALGATSLDSIRITGWGSDYVFGQAYDGRSPWPRFHVLDYELAIDYATPSLRDRRRRAQAEDPPLGGGFQPLVGEQRPEVLLSGRYAWDLDGGTAVPAEPERDLRDAVAARTTQIWMTPHGFVKAAQAGTPTLRTRSVLGETQTVIAVMLPGGVMLEGVLDSERLVERVTTWMANAVLGDIALEAVYSDYQSFDGVSVPTRIVQRQAGFPLLDIHVTDVEINSVEPPDVPASIRTRTPPARFVSTPEALAPGVWSIPLGSRDRSVLVEFDGYVVVFDAPEESAGVTEVGLEAIRRQWPNTPIRYIINTHTHFDHSSGLRAYAAEGATVITHESNVAYYEQAWANPRRLEPDALSRTARMPVFEGVVGSRTLTDGKRRLEIHHYPGNMHNPGMLMAYLPAERMLLQADSFNPANSYGSRPVAMPNLVHFHDAIERLKLDVEHIVPVHGRITTMEELRLVVERYAD